MLVASRNLLGRAVRSGNLVGSPEINLSAALLQSSLPTTQTQTLNNNRQYYPTRYFTSTLYNSEQPNIKLYQYHICPFCNITKSLLSYTKLNYETVEVNPLTKAELKPWSGEYKKVPIALINDKQINGSEEIIDTILSMEVVQDILQKQNDNESSDDFQTSDSAKKWTRFAVDDLAALLYPNICGTLGDSCKLVDELSCISSSNTR